MVEGIRASDLARAAIEAARRQHGAASRQLAAELPASGPAGAPAAPRVAATATGPEGTGFSGALLEQVRDVDQGVRAVERLPLDLISGNVQDFHEVAMKLKQSEMSFRFALEVRNKLIDAYREVMRMSV